MLTLDRGINMSVARIFIFLSLCIPQQFFAAIKTPAEHILCAIPYGKSTVSIIDKHEWKELQLDRLVTQLDRTKTSFGRWGLTYLLAPIANHYEIQERQKIISFLV